MRKRIALFGAIAAVGITALIATLAALDVIAVRDLRETLGRTLMVVTLVTTATVLVMTIAKAALPPRAQADTKKS
jgi:hypothetical protein